MVGFLDYDKIRTPATPLTEKELEYSANDVIIVVDYIHEQIDEYGSITKIPLTNTGYRDSYILAGYSLDLVAKNLHNHKIKKLVGFLDYDKIRTPATPLTEKELEYSANDVIIVVDYIHEQIDEYGSITKIPLTNTGRVRQFTRDYVFYNHRKDHRKTGGTYGRYRRLMSILTIDKGTYQQAKRAFQGGFTHANAHKQGKVIDNVSSFDFTSSYPTVMVAEKFPMSRCIKF